MRINAALRIVCGFQIELEKFTGKKGQIDSFDVVFQTPSVFHDLFIFIMFELLRILKDLNNCCQELLDSNGTI